MIARVGGQVVLVTGAIPGEQVTARIERVGKGVAFAGIVAVDEPSPDRREPFDRSALRRLPVRPHRLSAPAGDQGAGHRRRVRAHRPHPAARARGGCAARRTTATGCGRACTCAAGGSASFARARTCSATPRGTRQLLPATCDVLERLPAGLRALGIGERAANSTCRRTSTRPQRVVHLEAMGAAGHSSARCARRTPKVSPALSCQPPAWRKARRHGGRAARRRRAGARRAHGRAPAPRALVLPGQPLPAAAARRSCGRCRSQPETSVVDLYAGAGLFSVAAAAAERRSGHRGRRRPGGGGRSGARTRAALVGAVEAVHEPVETFVARQHRRRRC